MKAPKPMSVALVLIALMPFALAESNSPVPDTPNQEPAYQGRTLTEWLEVMQGDPFGPSYARAQDAIRNIGSAAVPQLIADLQAANETRRNGAWRAFRLFGTNAAPAVPELVAMLARDESPKLGVRVLGMIGQAACTPEAVRAAAEYSLSGDPFLSRFATETLADWGPSASNAIPKLLRGLHAQTEAGGPNRSAILPPAPSFSGALARIGLDSREVLAELLLAKNDPQSGSARRYWITHSKSGPSIVQSVITDSAMPISSRVLAIGALSNEKNTNLLSSLDGLLKESALRQPLARYVMRLGTNAVGALPALVEVAARHARDDKRFAELVCYNVIRSCTRGMDGPLIYQLLPLTFDERYPIDAGYPRSEGIPACVIFRGSLEIAAGGRARLIPLLIDALRHRDWQIRNAAAVHFLGYPEVPPEAATVLAGCLHDSNEIVRLSAAVAIRRFPEYRREALTNLLAAIASPTLSTPLRLHGIRMLHPWHLDAREFPDATNVLEAATKDKDNEIRRFAAQTLVDIAKRTPNGESPKSDASH